MPETIKTILVHTALHCDANGQTVPFFACSALSIAQIDTVAHILDAMYEGEDGFYLNRSDAYGELESNSLFLNNHIQRVVEFSTHESCWVAAVKEVGYCVWLITHGDLSAQEVVKWSDFELKSAYQQGKALSISVIAIGPDAE